MADFSTTAAKRPTITVGDVNGVEHPFEVLPFTTSRMVAAAKYANALSELQAQAQAQADAGAVTDAGFVTELQKLAAQSIDERVRSLNGPTTIESLCADELIEFKNVRQIGEYLQREATGDPPA
jgi:hypothetical protein